MRAAGLLRRDPAAAEEGDVISRCSPNCCADCHEINGDTVVAFGLSSCPSMWAFIDTTSFDNGGVVDVLAVFSVHSVKPYSHVAVS